MIIVTHRRKQPEKTEPPVDEQTRLQIDNMLAMLDRYWTRAAAEDQDD